MNKERSTSNVEVKPPHHSSFLVPCSLFDIQKKSLIKKMRLNKYGSYLLSRIVVQYHRP
jgi:hypothetical protein